MFSSSKQNKINTNSIKESLNPDNNKTWWNVRDGFIVKTTYNETNNNYSIRKQPFNIKPCGIPIHFQTNVISEY